MCRCHPDGLLLLLGLTLPFGLSVLFAIIVLLIAIIKQKLLTTATLRTTAARYYIIYVVFIVGWSLGLARTIMSLDMTVSIILDSLFIVSGSLLGLYIFLMYCLFVSDVKMIWKRLYYRLTCKNYQHHEMETPDHSKGDIPEDKPLPRPEKYLAAYSSAIGELKQLQYKNLSNKSVSPDNISQEVYRNNYRESSSDDSCVDLPVSKTELPRSPTIEEERLDSNEFDQPDPSEETEL